MLTPIPNRRAFLQTTLGGLAGLSLAQAVAQAQNGPGNLATKRLGDDIFIITGAGANVVAQTGPDGVVMVDGGLAEHSANLTKAITALPGGRPVRTLFNTHWHPEQTGSNLSMRRAGATIIAHENTRLWLTQEINRPGEDHVYQPAPKEALPDKTFYTSDALTVDGERIAYGYMLQAHTDGDIYVHFPKSNVLVIGDVISGAGWPVIDWWTGGWINGIVSGLDTLLKVANEQTKVVPAQGPVLSRADLEAQFKMFTAISQRLRTMMFGGKSLDDAIAADPTKEYNAKLGDPKQFVRLAFQSMWGHFTPDA